MLFLTPLFLAAQLAAAAPTPAQTMRVDLTGARLFNFCTMEPTFVTEGSANLIVREDFGGDVDGVHLLHRIAGHGASTGGFTGNAYLFNFVVPPSFFPTSNNNQYGDHGMVNLVANIELINRDDPSSGVSRATAIIVTLLDFSAGVAADTKVEVVSMECAGR